MLSRSPVVAYSAALAAVAAAVAVRLLLSPVLGSDLPFITLFVAVVFSAWYGGPGPALVALSASALGAAYFFLEPLYSFRINALQHQVGLALYGVVGLASIAMFRDVSDRRQQERELEARERQFRTLAESIPQLAWMANPDGYIFWYNRRWYDYTGTTFEQMEGWGWQSVHDALELPRVMDRWQASIATGQPFDMVFPLRGTDGLFRPFLTRVEPLRNDDGGVARWFGTNTDISAQKQIEDQLRQSEATLADFFDNATVGLHVVGADGTILRANAAELALLGYSPEEYVGRPINEFHADEAVIGDILDRLLAGEKLHDYPARLRCKDGSIKEVLIDSSGWFRDGKFVHTRCFTRDVTGKKHNEAVLAGQKRVLELLVQGAPLPDVLDTLCQIVEEQHSNTVTATILLIDEGGSRLRSVAGRRAPAEYAHAVDGVPVGPRAGSCGTAAYRGEPVIVEDIATDPLWADYRDPALRHGFRACWSTPFFSSQGKVLGTLAVYYSTRRRPSPDEQLLMDILTRTAGIAVERRRDEEALRGAEQRWRSLAEAVPNLVWTDLPDGQCDYLSRQWAIYTGIPEHELLGLQWLEKVIHPDDRERTLACWQRACADEGDYDLEYRIRRHDGVYHWFRTRGVPMRDSHGKIVYWIGTCTDIEDYKHAEQALQAADRRKDEFLAILAHELRNPLAPVKNSLELMKRNSDPQIVQQARSTMERQIGQMVRLIDDLLDVSRITSDKLELKMQRVELAHIIHQALEACRADYESARHEVTVRLPPEPIYLYADPVRLAQVFGNLLTNACKYTQPGGRISLSAECDGSTVAVRVTDNGVGIPHEMLLTVFELFTQVDRSLQRSQGGLGIGLSLVKRLSEMHGGTVTAHSEGLGRGSEFVVRLPVFNSKLTTESPPGPASESIQPGVSRILIVDDNRDGAESLALLLRMSDHETQIAHDGAEAFEKAEAFRPEVILLDIGLPKMNGYDACRAIREQPWGKDIIIVAMTGWGQDEDRRRSTEAGFDSHMVKPMTHADLMKLLASLSATRSVRQATPVVS